MPSQPVPPAHARRSPATRTRSAELLRSIGHELGAASVLLSEDPPPAAVREALAGLQRAREALALLMLDRASGPSARQRLASPVLVRRVLLDAGPAAVALAQGFCQETARLWALSPAATDAVRATLTELVQAAVGAGAVAPLIVALERDLDQVLVRVWDDVPADVRLLPHQRAVRVEDGGKWVSAAVALQGRDLRPPR